MKLGHGYLENTIRLFLFGGGVCLLGGKAFGSSLLAFIGGVMLGIVLLPAIIIGPVLLIMRLTGWGIAHPNRSHTAQHGDPPSDEKGSI